MSHGPEAPQYLHSYGDATDLGELEVERLRLLNTAYSPTAHAMLAPHLKPGMEVLELGVGTGEIGSWLAEKVGAEGKYIAIDKDPQQLAKAARLIHGSQVHLIAADALRLSDSAEFSAQRPAEGFNLVYCRWFLCHITEAQRTKLIQHIMSLLAPNGVFICEEPDYRNMRLKERGAITPSPAIDSWKDIVKGLQAKPSLGLDLEMDDSKLTAELQKAILGHAGYHAEIICRFEAELTNGQKHALVLGIQTAAKAILSLGKAPAEVDTLLSQLRIIESNPDQSVVFYTNTFAKLTRSVDSMTAALPLPT